MSELKTDKLTGKTSAGDVTITSEGGSATMQLQQGVVKNWVAFHGSNTAAIQDSLNSSSLTDNAVGKYTIDMTSGMSNGNYSCQSQCSNDGGNAYNRMACANYKSTTAYYVATFDTAASLRDIVNVDSGIFGDLA